MKNYTCGSNGNAKDTIGLDLGDKYTHYHVIDSGGESVEQGRLRTTPDAFRARFGSMKPARVALETGTHSPWVSRLLAELNHEVLVANPRQLPLIYENAKKDDQTDPEIIARLARYDPKLLKPIEHRPKEVQVELATLRSRDVLVAVRTKLINHVRGSVKAFGGRIPTSSSPKFPSLARESIPEELRSVLSPVVDLIEKIADEIKGYDGQIEDLAEKHPATKVLRQISGVGALTALAFVLILWDPRRFAKSRTVGGYLGLVPRKDESGEQKPQLRITKAGDPFLRRLLVSSAQYILGPFGPDTDLKRFGEAIARRGGKNAKKRAVVAVARKLSVLLHRLWLTGEVYEPLRISKIKRARSKPSSSSENGKA